MRIKKTSLEEWEKADDVGELNGKQIDQNS